MAIQDQLATVEDLDEPFFNYSASVDIAAGVAVTLDKTNYVGDGTHFIPGVILPTTGGNPTLCIGITMETIKAGNTGRVRTQGTAVATAEGGITVGDCVDAGVTTAGRVKTHAAAKNSLGFARSQAADGDPVQVWLAPSVNA